MSSQGDFTLYRDCFLLSPSQKFPKTHTSINLFTLFFELIYLIGVYCFTQEYFSIYDSGQHKGERKKQAVPRGN